MSSTAGTITPAERERPSWAFCMAVFLIVMGSSVLLYRDAFRIKPASDDFGAMVEIQRGHDLGISSFFTRPYRVKNYRPLQSMATWAFGSLPGDQMAWLRTLHLVSLGVLVFAVILWARQMPLSRSGLASAAIITAFHPVMPGQIASMDTFSSMLSPALMWIAAWVLLVWRANLARAIPAALAIFIVAIGFKEYAYGLAPLGAWTLLWFRDRGRWRAAIGAGLVFTLTVALLMWARGFTTPDDAAGAAVVLPKLSPRFVPLNLGMYALALFEPINTVWIFSHRTEAMGMMAAGAALMIMAGLLAGGLRRRVLSGSGSDVAQVKSWTVFLVVAGAASTFPNCVLEKISEVYTSAPLVALALLGGLAVDGWRAARPPLRIAAAVSGLGLAVCAVVVTGFKVAGIWACGDLADVQLRQIIALLPPGASSQRIALVFLNADVTPRQYYSVYRMDDDMPAFDPDALDWLKPGLGLRTVQVHVDRLEDFDPWGYDSALYWDATARQFRMIERKP